jgi:hypothetical protein
VASKFNIEAHTFNSAESVTGTFRAVKGKVFNYRTHFDPVSILAQHSIRVQPRIGNEHTPESVHRLNNFFDKNAKRVVHDGEVKLVSTKASSLQEHVGQVGFIADLAFVAYDIRQFIKKKQSFLQTADNIITKDLMMPNPTQLVLDSPDSAGITDALTEEMRQRREAFLQRRRIDWSGLRQVMGEGFRTEIPRRAERRTRFSTQVVTE